MKKFLGLSFFGVLASILVSGSSADAQLLPRNRVVLLATPAPVKAQAPAPVAAEASKKLGPVACAVVRMHLRDEYKKKGMSLVERVRKANEATDDVINGLVADAEKVAGKKFGAIGDGTILNVIIEFFKSPQGQALIAALIELLIHSLGG